MAGWGHGFQQDTCLKSSVAMTSWSIKSADHQEVSHFLGKIQSFDLAAQMVPYAEITRMHPDVGEGLQFPLLHCPMTCSTKRQEVHATRGTS